MKTTARMANQIPLLNRTASRATNHTRLHKTEKALKTLIIPGNARVLRVKPAKKKTREERDFQIKPIFLTVGITEAFG